MLWNMKVRDKRESFNKCSSVEFKILKNTDSGLIVMIVIDHNYGNTNLWYGRCTSVTCDNVHIPTACWCQTAWVERGKTFHGTRCFVGQSQILNVVLVNWGQCRWLLIMLLENYRKDCASICMRCVRMSIVNLLTEWHDIYGKTHWQINKGMPCFNVNTKLGTGTYVLVYCDQ